MNFYEFDWNAEKASRNEQKHGVTFEEAATVFEDVFAVEVFDKTHSDEEDRWIMIGVSRNDRILLVAFTLRDLKIRLISAREARHRERLEYEKQVSE